MSRGAKSLLEQRIEAPATVPDTTPKTIIRTLSRSQLSTSMVVPVEADAAQVKLEITRWGYHWQAWGASLLVFTKPTVIKAILDRAGIACQIRETISVNHATA